VCGIVGYVGPRPCVDLIVGGLRRLEYRGYDSAGVAALGPNRAGVFGNLMPVFGTILAVIFLGESFQAFHAVGIGLILAGVYLAGRSGAPRAAPPAAR
jgi:hypothetical protein